MHFWLFLAINLEIFLQLQRNTFVKPFEFLPSLPNFYLEYYCFSSSKFTLPTMQDLIYSINFKYYKVNNLFNAFQSHFKRTLVLTSENLVTIRSQRFFHSKYTITHAVDTTRIIPKYFIRKDVRTSY